MDVLKFLMWRQGQRRADKMCMTIWARLLLHHSVCASTLWYFSNFFTTKCFCCFHTSRTIYLIPAAIDRTTPSCYMLQRPPSHAIRLRPIVFYLHFSLYPLALQRDRSSKKREFMQATHSVNHHAQFHLHFSLHTLTAVRSSKKERWFRQHPLS